MTPDASRPIVIIDDSNEDYDITCILLAELGVRNPVVRFPDGRTALGYIRREAVDNDLQRPAVILLDLNLPAVNGRELLMEIRAADWLRTVPVLITSTSNNPADVELCYMRGANTYFIKPADFARYERMISVIRQYWLEIAATPRAA